MEEFNYKNLDLWEVEIIEKYPLIYLEGCAPGQVNLRYSFEFDSGWAKLVDEFSNIASELVEDLRIAIQPDAYIHSCIFKAKFARLTWQGDNNLIEPYRTLFRAYVNEIEHKSTTICEITGKYGKIRTDIGWIKTLCDDEYNKIKPDEK